MTRQLTGAVPFIEHSFERFLSAYENQDYGSALEFFINALWADAGIAYRYFVTRASFAINTVAVSTGKTADLVAWLDLLIVPYPNMHLLCDDDPQTIRRLVALREDNIRKDLPSVVMATQPKSASVTVANIFNSGFNLPSFAYSLIAEEVIESWARDYARGGACYATHLKPTPENISRFRRAGVNKIIVHIRDPRQSLLSFIHHVSLYPEQAISLVNSGFREKSRAGPGNLNRTISGVSA